MANWDFGGLVGNSRNQEGLALSPVMLGRAGASRAAPATATGRAGGWRTPGPASLPKEGAIRGSKFQVSD